MLNFSNCKVNNLPVLFVYLCACLSICLFRPRLSLPASVCMFVLSAYVSVLLTLLPRKKRTRQDKSKIRHDKEGDKTIQDEERKKKRGRDEKKATPDRPDRGRP